MYTVLAVIGYFYEIVFAKTTREVSFIVYSREKCRVTRIVSILKLKRNGNSDPV